jgi:ABC-2 type transport system permease protein
LTFTGSRVRGGRLIRTLAFFRKDLVEALRQPRLILTLVLGPFLILMLFGFGFRPAPPTLRTVFVMPAESELTERTDELLEAMGPRVSLVTTVSDAAEANEYLASGEADVIVSIPGDAIEMVRGSSRAPINVRHNQIDPFESSFIELFAQSGVEQVNRRVLQELVTIGQDKAESADAAVGTARAALAAIEESLASGDRTGVQAGQEELVRSLDQVATDLDPAMSVIRGVESQTGASPRDALSSAQGRAEQLGSEPGDQAGATVAALREDLDVLESEIEQFMSIDPAVLVSPFVSNTANFQDIEVPFSSYYIPGVVALLAQHLALTFAALSLVRERTLGTVELFRASPVSGGETLIGKYLASFTIGAVVVGLLTAGAVFFFDFNPAGSWGWYAVMSGLVLLASLGLGFVLAAAAANESQAVQYAMISLLVSIFFSGFFISLQRLIPPVRTLSYLIPASYGISGLQDIAFRGTAPDPIMVAGAAVLSIALMAVAWVLIHRRVVGAR